PPGSSARRPEHEPERVAAERVQLVTQLRDEEAIEIHADCRGPHARGWFETVGTRAIVASTVVLRVGVRAPGGIPAWEPAEAGTPTRPVRIDGTAGRCSYPSAGTPLRPLRWSGSSRVAGPRRSRRGAPLRTSLAQALEEVGRMLRGASCTGRTVELGLG